MSDTISNIVIIGAGHCGGQLATRLRAEGFEGTIKLVGAETHLPYQRPPLSKQYLAGAVDLDRVLLRPATHYEEQRIDVLLGTRVEAVHVQSKDIQLTGGERVPYDRLVMTTGSKVRKLNVPGAELDGIHYLRTVEDCDSIRERLSEGLQLAVVGGGYIGLEVAAVAAGRGANVTVLEMDGRVMSRVAAPEVSAFYEARHAQHGVDVRTGVRVEGFEGESKVTGVVCAGAATVPADAVVVGIGIAANDDLAAAAGLSVDDGIVVDEYGQTSDPDVYAAGDCTRHPNAIYGRSVRLESVHNAMAQAKAVAANLCTKPTPYAETPWFWSDQYDLKLQIAGLSEGYDRTVLRGSPDDGAFSVLYLKDGVLVAGDSVGSMQDHLALRALIARQANIDPDRLADPSTPLKSLT
ncbi:MAG: NAD(P)/FAD-dependent oxidoreductase [Gammaproteobacteria bacterium]